MQKPKITFSKEIISKGDEHLHCCLCQYGKKEGIILWRIEFRGEFYGFHWLLCNKCRFAMFVAMGGKRLKNYSSDAGPLMKEPKQKISNKGKVKTSYYHSMSPDRQAALDKGMSVKEYEGKHQKWLEKEKRKKKSKKKKK